MGQTIKEAYNIVILGKQIPTKLLHWA